MALLLLIACTNIANLLLIRASEREEEIAVRRALGVSPARMLRQLLTEAVVLAVIGGAAGTAVAFWVTGLLTTNGPAEIPRLSEVSPDARVLGYAIALSLATGVLFGLAPARMLVARPDVAGLGSRRTTSGPGAWRYRASLIAGNVALCVLLLVGSGLLVRSFGRLLAVDTGFTPEQLLTFQVSLDRRPLSAERRRHAVLRRPDGAAPGDARRRERQLVVDVAAHGFDRSNDRSDRGPAARESCCRADADTYIVRPDYFSTMGIPVLGGRPFESADGERAAPVAIISKTMAEELWPGEDPIGRRIRVPGAPMGPLRTIVGIVGEVKHYGLHMPVTKQVYVPHAQPPFGRSGS